MAGRPKEWPLRLAGSLFGLAAGALGLFTLLSPQDLTPLEHDRAQAFGFSALVVGTVALLGSLLTRDVHALWYCSPRRWHPFRTDLLDGPDPPPSPRDDPTPSP